ncbi:Emopamil-binding protein [Canariomyces notabilis]|uniref:Emopamil-binding protein n=1 Tax=Canariomyces notabilis TaxID=2074819 RepID=A0AAN6TIX9_9PEZI|nr:Emopamil-binding protein [Canariomyces arenarius]
MPDKQSHPYFPQDSAVPGYVPNSAPLLVITGAFGGIIAVFLLGCISLARWCNPALKKAEQLAIGWFVLCGFLHCFFEGYFVLNHASITSSQSLFAQLWKEYSLSDSRYMTSDPFMLCIETLTTLTWGPLSLLTALLIALSSKPGSTSGRYHGTRHLLQTVVCVGHLYGVALYYGTCGFAEHMRGLSYSRPEPLYYWGYFAGMNAPWAVVPCVLLLQSAKAIQGAFAAAGRAEERKKVR